MRKKDQSRPATSHPPASPDAAAAGHRVEEALRQSESLYRALFESMTEGFALHEIVTDRNGKPCDYRYLEVNPAFERLMGKTRAEVVGRLKREATPGEDEFWISTYGAVALGGPPAHFEHRSPSSNRHWLVYAYSPAPRQFAVLFSDITQRKQAEEALERERQTLWHMLEASDHERQLIAYEIHDGLAQYLAAARMQFQIHSMLRERDPIEAQKALDTALQLINQSHFEARRLISGVRPPVLDEAGVEAAIAHLVHDERKFKGLQIEFQSEVQFDRLPSVVENAVYRIAQEALTNASQHSQSKKVKVRLSQKGPKIQLEVRDWGVGFDARDIKPGHFGLEGIRERVRLLGGLFDIDTAPGKGTCLVVEVPILGKSRA